MAHSSSADRDPLDRLAEEFVARFRRGERPSLTEYAERLPERADEVRDLFPALVEMEQLKPVTADQTGGYVPSIEPSDPVRLGEFRILRRVGAGGMGVVYEAVQESLGRHVALKLLPAEALMDPKKLERFRREAKSAAKLHHTNIVPVFGTGEADGRHFYAMQFISGHPLDGVIDEVKRLKDKSGTVAPPPSERAVSVVAAALVTGTFASAPGSHSSLDHVPTAPDGRPLPAPSGSVSDTSALSSHSFSGGGNSYWATVARVGAQVADGLAYAHTQGVQHRDIKPANLLLDLRGTVWITDFGLAKASDADDGLTQMGDIVGTLRYMAPERFDGTGDHRADIYALGLTLYELLTLTPAFAASNRAKLVEQAVAANPPRPRSINPSIPKDLETIVLKAIARDPAMRYQTAGELADDLRRYQEDRPIRARRASSTEQAWRWCRRNPAVASLLAAVVLVFTAGSAVAWYFAAEARSALRFANEAREAVEEEQKKATEESRRAEVARDQAEDLLYAGRVYQANIAAGEYRTERFVQLLDEARPKADEKDRRGWEWHYLKRLTRTWDTEVLLPIPESTDSRQLPPQYKFSLDCSRVAVMPRYGGFRGRGGEAAGIYETTTGTQVGDLPELNDARKPSEGRNFIVTTLSPDLAFAAVSERFQTAVDVPAGFVGPPEEKTLVRVRLSNLRGGKPGPAETVFSGPTGYVNPFVAVGGNRVVVSVSWFDGEAPSGVKPFVEVWERGGVKPRRTRFEPGDDASVVAVSPDGMFAVVSVTDRPEGGKADGPVRGADLWSLTGKPTRIKRLTSDAASNTDWYSIAAFSPNGRVLAVAEPGTAIGVFDARTGERLGRWLVPRDVTALYLSDLSVSDDGQRLACVGKGGTLVTAERVGNSVSPVPVGVNQPDRDKGGVWRSSAFRQPQSNSSFGGGLNGGLSLAADGRKLFAMSGPTLREWDLTRTGFAATWPEALRLGDQASFALPAERGRMLLYTSSIFWGQPQDKMYRFRVLDPQRPETARDFDAVGRSVRGTVSSDGRRLLLTYSGTKSRWSLRATNAPEKEIEGGESFARFSDDGHWLYTIPATADDPRLWVRRAEDGRIACDLPVPPDDAIAGAWVTRAGVLVVATRPKSEPEGTRQPDPVALTFRFHDIETGALRGTWTSPPLWAWMSNFFDANSWVLVPPMVFHSADGRKVGVKHDAADGAIRVWVVNGGTGAQEAEFTAPAPEKAATGRIRFGGGTMYSGAFEPDGRVSVGSGEDLVTWARPDAAPVRLTGHRNFAAVAFTANGRRAFTLDTPPNDDEAVVRAWDPVNGRELLTIRFKMSDQSTFMDQLHNEMWLEGDRLHVLTSLGVRVFDGTPLKEGTK